MRNQLHPLVKWGAYRHDTKPLAGRDLWVADLVQWPGSNNRVVRGLKPWDGVGGAQILPVNIRSHI